MSTERAVHELQGASVGASRLGAGGGARSRALRARIRGRARRRGRVLARRLAPAGKLLGGRADRAHDHRRDRRARPRRAHLVALLGRGASVQAPSPLEAAPRAGPAHGGDRRIPGGAHAGAFRSIRSGKAPGNVVRRPRRSRSTRRPLRMARWTARGHEAPPSRPAPRSGSVALFLIYRQPSGPAREDRDDASLDRAIAAGLEGLESDPDPRRAVIKAYSGMEHALAEDGLPRRPSETPLEYLRRALERLQASQAATARLTGALRAGEVLDPRDRRAHAARGARRARRPPSGAGAMSRLVLRLIGLALAATVGLVLVVDLGVKRPGLAVEVYLDFLCGLLLFWLVVTVRSRLPAASELGRVRVRQPVRQGRAAAAARMARAADRRHASLRLRASVPVPAGGPERSRRPRSCASTAS